MDRIIKKAAAILLAVICIIVVPSRVCMLGSYAAEQPVSAIWPLDKSFQKITTYFNPLRNEYDVSGYHNAIDIEADAGANIFAPYPGTCISAGWMDAYGNMVILFHEDLGVYTFYAHCSSMDITAGKAVSGGDVIAHVGSTGQSSGNHLHFGICDKLLSGWPNRTYYDPLTYFKFDGTAVANPNAAPSSGGASCDCKADYAGIYTTKGVVTFLYIRAGHSADSAALGQIPAGAQVMVTMGNGKWAHVEYNGVKGYSSMDYLEKVKDIESSMTIANATKPSSTLALGSAFGVRGTITSALPITKVWGGVYSKDGATAVQTAEAAPNATTYNLSGYFDSHIVFNKLTEGTYIYRIEAEDTSGKKFTLIDAVFSVGKSNILAGDLNNDSKVGIADAVIMQNYLLGGAKFTELQFLSADMNKDKSVDTFDLIVMRKKLVEGMEKTPETTTTSAATTAAATTTTTTATAAPATTKASTTAPPATTTAPATTAHATTASPATTAAATTTASATTGSVETW